MAREGCSLLHCIQGELLLKMAQVHVRAYDIRAEDATHMEVLWSRHGEASFHDICWKALMDSVKMDNPFALCAREKDMLIVCKKTAEYFDSLDKVKAEAERVAQMIKSSKYTVAFTGAGVSTTAGIGDFRGRVGKWTERDKMKNYGTSCKPMSHEVNFEALRPTYTHEALCYLLELGYIKHIISQNTDGLHRLSGVSRDNLSELHGNSFHEKCDKCGTRYERFHAARRSPGPAVTSKACVHCHFDHSTGVQCERKGCDGMLMNCIINFGDSLEKKVLTLAAEHARRSDLMLCLGSSLRVAPACDLVEMGLSPLRLVICNRQPTPMDRLCYIGRPGDRQALRIAEALNLSPTEYSKSSENNANQSDKLHQIHLCSVQGLPSPEQPVVRPLVTQNDLSPTMPQLSLIIGSRVFGDCDVLLREIMLRVLTTEEMDGWQKSLPQRCEQYAKQRRGLGSDAVDMEISKF